MGVWYWLNLGLVVAFGALRVAGHKGNAYKALAHCYVGFLFGLGIGLGPSDPGYIQLAWVLTLIEVGAFLVTRAWPWWRSRSRRSAF